VPEAHFGKVSVKNCNGKHILVYQNSFVTKIVLPLIAGKIPGPSLAEKPASRTPNPTAKENNMATSFPELQNGLYNFMMQALGLTDANNFQLIQPAVSFPSPQTTDATVWNWMNQIPPFALIQSGSGGDQFFSDYAAVMSALVPSVSINFAGDIGPAANTAWNTYLSQLVPLPAVTQLPSVFLTWALTHGFAAVADKGSSDLSAMLLDPILRAQLSLQPYLNIPGVNQGIPPNWSLGYAQLVIQLANAPNATLISANVQSNTDVSKSWASQSSSNSFLWWGGSESSSNSSISSNFAAQSVSVNVSFDHALSLPAVPGAWYDSGALGLAYSSQNTAPWNPNSAITWPKTFGPSGNMQRFCGSLILVSGMKVVVTSSYVFSSSEQTTVNKNSSYGLWPFYGSSSSSTTTSHQFIGAGQLQITVSSPANVPTLVGMAVIPVAQYLGPAVAGRAKFLKLASAISSRAA
jgi:hypothetical protein